MKQEEFNNLREEIDRVFIGLDQDFYDPSSASLLPSHSSSKVII